MNIKRLVVACVLSAGIIASGEVAAVAAPLMIAPPSLVQNSDSLVEQARLVCVNRYSGRIIHWGGCGGYRRHYYFRHYHHSRFYCRNRYTGRFLYWGRC